VYAPVDGVFRTNARIGDAVQKGQPIAEIGSMTLVAPLDGLLRGLSRDGGPVTVRTKVIQGDPRSREAAVEGIARPPRQLAEAVLSAVRASSFNNQQSR